MHVILANMKQKESKANFYKFRLHAGNPGKQEAKEISSFTNLHA